VIIFLLLLAYGIIYQAATLSISRRRARTVLLDAPSAGPARSVLRVGCGVLLGSSHRALMTSALTVVRFIVPISNTPKLYCEMAHENAYVTAYRAAFPKPLLGIQNASLTKSGRKLSRMVALPNVSPCGFRAMLPEPSIRKYPGRSRLEALLKLTCFIFSVY
jgi:hypothetical protein